MSNYVTLIGAEEVSRAGSSVSSAAREMKEAANTISDALYQQRQFMDDWLLRFETVLKENK